MRPGRISALPGLRHAHLRCPRRDLRGLRRGFLRYVPRLPFPGAASEESRKGRGTPAEIGIGAQSGVAASCAGIAVQLVNNAAPMRVEACRGVWGGVASDLCMMMPCADGPQLLSNRTEVSRPFETARELYDSSGDGREQQTVEVSQAVSYVRRYSGNPTRRTSA